MNIREVQNILNRKSGSEELNKYSTLLNNTVNFGTHILNWEIEFYRSYKENIVYETFFKSILEIGDGISILIQNSSIENSKILFRSMLENIFSLEYLLEKDVKKRALAYILTTLHKEINLDAKMDINNEVGKAYIAELKKDKTFKTAPFLDIKSSGRNEKSELKKILTHSELREIENEYQKTAAKHKNPTWYSLFDGPKNIEQLAKYLNHNALYEMIYRGYSEIAHSSNAIKYNLIETQNGHAIGPIRGGEDSKLVSQIVLTSLEMAFSNYVINRLPDKGAVYKEWQSEFNKEYDELSR